ncbi:hypothetical protein BpHYR1_023872 [Brachionus plicatilis]|uniref:Uncharacterized protein n=1 Tax=Brachionus plicatilis TaxID=10195 RepID=A0A3M7QP91_BRAPC|nr:hypothetical protein BpHYR1_023872 [Brachionus plicatilis]
MSILKISSMYFSNHFENAVKASKANKIFVFESRELKKIPEKPFLLNFNDNLITRLEDKIFEGLDNLEQIHLSSNRIEHLDKNIFNGLFKLSQGNLISELDENIFNDNRIKSLKSLPLDLFSNLHNLLVTEFSNNRINFLDIDQIKQYFYIIDFTQNFNLNDFHITFESCFSFKDKNFWFVDEKQKNTDLKQLKRRFCSIFLNKTRTNYETLFSKNPNSLKNSYDSLNIIERLVRIDNLAWSILDFFIFLPKYVFSNQDLVNFHRYITQRLEENLLVVNLEYSFLTTEVIEALFERDDEYLIDLFLPKQSFQDFISNKQNDGGKSLKKIYKYINAERLRDFFPNINYSKCLEIALEKDNENLSEDSKITEFNEKFLNEYLIQIFQKEWYIFVGLLLDYSIDKNTENFEDTQNINVTDNQVLPEQNSKNLPKEKSKNILTLIKLTKQNDFLRHPTTKKILKEKWKYLPAYLYHANLAIYLLFVIFYSINIELYKLIEVIDSFY